MTDADAPRPSRRYRVVAWIVVAFVRLLGWRVRVRGLEHVPRAGGAVITWNHHSHIDFLMTALDIYRRLDRPVRFLAKREVWRSRLFGWVPRFAEAIPVDRRSAGGRAGALSAAVEALEDGDLVLVAPEGTISRSFELLPFRTGAVRMAQAAGVPVVPSVNWGTHRLSTTGHPVNPFRALRIPIEVRFGPPVEVGPGEDPAAVTGKVHGEMAAMLDEVQRTYPDGTPEDAWWVPARLGGGAPSHDEVLAERQARKGHP